MAMTTLIQEEIVDKIWNRYVVSKEGIRLSWSGKPVFERYNRVARRSKIAQEFEAWLFSHGALIRRIDKHVYLEFADEHSATMFALAHA